MAKYYEQYSCFIFGFKLEVVDYNSNDPKSSTVLEVLDNNFVYYAPVKLSSASYPSDNSQKTGNYTFLTDLFENNALVGTWCILSRDSEYTDIDTLLLYAPATKLYRNTTTGMGIKVTDNATGNYAILSPNASYFYTADDTLLDTISGSTLGSTLATATTTNQNRISAFMCITTHDGDTIQSVNRYVGASLRVGMLGTNVYSVNGGGPYASNTGLVRWLNALGAVIPPEPEDTDPYAGGGNSDVGGGTGNFDNSSDTIPVPNLPSISGLNTGFFTAFVASTSDMQGVANYLWTTLIPDISQGGVISQVIDSLKKVVSNPYDAIMGCSIIPVTPSTGGSKELKMYGVIQTGITIPYASSRWVTVDCGTLNINEYWGAYLDYSPYTKTTSLYLPYIGTVSIDIDLIMGKALQVVYHVDVLSGICVAYILVNGSVEFSYQGHCATTIPITTADFTSAIQSGLGLVGNVANIVSAGAGGGAVGGLGGAVLGAVGSAVSQSPAIASNVMNMKPDIKSGGGIGGAGGILGVQKPYLIVERPRQSAPARQNTYTGYPCNIALSIKDCTGYTEFETINLDGVLLTGEEKDELKQILQSGVYL